jgi:periplasmic protein TonB
MFEQTFINTPGQTRRPWTVAVSLALQIAFIAIALIVPLLRVASLDLPVKNPILLPFEKVDLKVKPELKATPHAAPAASRPIFRMLAQTPTAVPPHPDLTPDAPEIGNLPGAIGQAGPSLVGLPTGIVIQPPSVQVVKAVPPTPAVPVHVGGDVQAGKLLFGPKPAYPPLARATRTQGTVRIQAVIGRDGVIKSLELMSGPPLLVGVAMEAVRQWRYKPTLLNGEPVEVITVIDVNFTLSQ